MRRHRRPAPWRVPLLGSRVRAILALTCAACGDAAGPGGEDGPDGPVPPPWSRMAVPTDAQLLGVWGRTSSAAYAVGWNGTALAFDGERWRAETTTATVPLTEVAGAPEDPAVTFAVGWGGTILARTEAGVWAPAPRTSTTSADLFGVHLSAADLGFAVGDAGTVLVWDGLTWADADFAVTSELSGQLVRPRTALAGVFSANGRDWVVTGAGGASYRTPNRGASFEALDTRESVPLRGVWGPNAGTVYAVGLEGLVLRLTNRWRRDGDALPTRFLFGVWGRDGSDVTVVGWGGTTLRRFGGDWFVERSGSEVDLRDVWVDAPTGRAFAVGARGTILTRTSTISPLDYDPPPEADDEP